jgi:hypothetical protein
MVTGGSMIHSHYGPIESIHPWNPDHFMSIASWHVVLLIYVFLIAVDYPLLILTNLINSGSQFV